LNEIPFSFDAPETKVVHGPAEAPEYGPPPQSADGEEYICGNTGPGFPGNNPGRDPDRSRQDEMIPAQGCARYMS
jgi:hypothetical protein